jgi:response regulator RpfG family c-di-GMP phosphodiesterase
MYSLPVAEPESQTDFFPSESGIHRVLIIDDEEEIRHLCRLVLEPEGIGCDEAETGREGLATIRNRPYDLVLLDMAMPGLTGREVCQKLRQDPPCPNLKIVMFSGNLPSDDLAQMLAAGADDFIAKPFGMVELQARIQAALRLKDAQDRADRLQSKMWGTNLLLEQNLHAKGRDLVNAHQGLVLALAKLVECRDAETGAHLRRIQSYCRILAEETAKIPAFSSQINALFIQWLEWCAPLHDIGKAGIPDRILQKKGAFTPEERLLMQTHTVLGADTLVEVARHHGSGMGFLKMAIDITRHHHERFDGNGYPDRLAGSDIPLAARLLAIADVYDALRSRRVYKPALSHSEALEIMLHSSPGQFDPVLLQVFEKCAIQFERIFNQQAD